MNRDKEKNKPAQPETTRTRGQEKPGEIIDQRKEMKNTEDSPQTSEDTPEEKFYNDHNVDPFLAKKQ